MKKAIKKVLKEEEPKLGNTIITNDKFKPSSKDKDFGIQKGLEGTIIYKMGDAYGVEFEKEYDWTHNIEGLLFKKIGCYLEKKEFTIKDEYKNEDKNKQSFVESTQGLFYNQLIRIPKEIKELEKNINYSKSDIKGNKKNIIRKEKDIITQKNEINILCKNVKNKPTTDIYEKQFERLMKAQKIKSIEFIENYIIVNTNDLIYEKTKRIPESFNIGAFKFFIPLNSDDIRAVNYKKHVRKTYHHPCISEGGRICTGDRMRVDMNEYIKKNQIDLLVFLLISFFEKPNYNGPHVDDETFYCAQKVTMKPKDKLKWIDNKYFRTNNKWDEEKYRKDRNALDKKISEMNKEKGKKDTPPGWAADIGSTEF